MGHRQTHSRRHGRPQNRHRRGPEHHRARERTAPTGTFIVKVQRPIASTDPNVGYLFYNEDHSVHAELPAAPEVVKLMGDRLKIYAYAHLVDDGQGRGGKLISIDKLAPEQGW